MPVMVASSICVMAQQALGGLALHLGAAFFEALFARFGEQGLFFEGV
jgi:hypothetical protein